MVDTLKDAAKEMNIEYLIGKTHSKDSLYGMEMHYGPMAEQTK